MNKFLAWLSVVISFCHLVFFIALFFGFKPDFLSFYFAYLTISALFANNAISLFRKAKEASQ